MQTSKQINIKALAARHRRQSQSIYRKVYLKLFVLGVEARPCPCYGRCYYSACNCFPWIRPCPWLNTGGTRGNCLLHASCPYWWRWALVCTLIHWPKVTSTTGVMMQWWDHPPSVLFMKSVTSAASLKSSNQIFFHCASLHFPFL